MAADLPRRNGCMDKGTAATLPLSSRGPGGPAASLRIPESGRGRSPSSGCRWHGAAV